MAQGSEVHFARDKGPEFRWRVVPPLQVLTNSADSSAGARLHATAEPGVFGVGPDAAAETKSCGCEGEPHTCENDEDQQISALEEQVNDLDARRAAAESDLEQLRDLVDKLRKFAAEHIAMAKQEEERYGAVGAHKEVTERIVFERVLEILDGTEPTPSGARVDVKAAVDRYTAAKDAAPEKEEILESLKRVAADAVARGVRALTIPEIERKFGPQAAADARKEIDTARASASTEPAPLIIQQSSIIWRGKDGSVMLNVDAKTAARIAEVGSFSVQGSALETPSGWTSPEEVQRRNAKLRITALEEAADKQLVHIDRLNGERAALGGQLERAEKRLDRAIAICLDVCSRATTPMPEDRARVNEAGKEMHAMQAARQHETGGIVTRIPGAEQFIDAPSGRAGGIQWKAAKLGPPLDPARATSALPSPSKLWADAAGHRDAYIALMKKHGHIVEAVTARSNEMRLSFTALALKDTLRAARSARSAGLPGMAEEYDELAAQLAGEFRTLQDEPSAPMPYDELKKTRWYPAPRKPGDDTLRWFSVPLAPEECPDRMDREHQWRSVESADAPRGISGTLLIAAGITQICQSCNALREPPKAPAPTEPSRGDDHQVAEPSSAELQEARAAQLDEVERAFFETPLQSPCSVPGCRLDSGHKDDHAISPAFAAAMKADRDNLEALRAMPQEERERLMRDGADARIAATGTALDTVYRRGVDELPAAVFDYRAPDGTLRQQLVDDRVALADAERKHREEQAARGEDLRREDQRPNVQHAKMEGRVLHRGKGAMACFDGIASGAEPFEPRMTIQPESVVASGSLRVRVDGETAKRIAHLEKELAYRQAGQTEAYKLAAQRMRRYLDVANLVANFTTHDNLVAELKHALSDHADSSVLRARVTSAEQTTKTLQEMRDGIRDRHAAEMKVSHEIRDAAIRARDDAQAQIAELQKQIESATQENARLHKRLELECETTKSAIQERNDATASLYQERASGIAPAMEIADLQKRIAELNSEVDEATQSVERAWTDTKGRAAERDAMRTERDTANKTLDLWRRWAQQLTGPLPPMDDQQLIATVWGKIAAEAVRPIAIERDELKKKMEEGNHKALICIEDQRRALVAVREDLFQAKKEREAALAEAASLREGEAFAELKQKLAAAEERARRGWDDVKWRAQELDRRAATIDELTKDLASWRDWAHSWAAGSVKDDLRRRTLDERLARVPIGLSTAGELARAIAQRDKLAAERDQAKKDLHDEQRRYHEEHDRYVKMVKEGMDLRGKLDDMRAEAVRVEEAAAEFRKAAEEAMTPPPPARKDKDVIEITAKSWPGEIMLAHPVGLSPMSVIKCSGNCNDGLDKHGFFECAMCDRQACMACRGVVPTDENRPLKTCACRACITCKNAKHGSGYLDETEVEAWRKRVASKDS